MSLRISTRVGAENVSAPSFTSTPRQMLQRKCACGTTVGSTGECGACGRKSLLHQIANRPVFARNTAAKRLAIDSESPAPPIVHEVLRAPGEPLDPAIRSFMEPRFGYDFSRVRVHTDRRASESAQGVNANAYTVGNHIVFDSDNYSPQTITGQRLLTHELAHVAQQAGSISPTVLRLGRAESSFERAAEYAQRTYDSTEAKRFPKQPQRAELTAERNGDGRSPFANFTSVTTPPLTFEQLRSYLHPDFDSVAVERLSDQELRRWLELIRHEIDSGELGAGDLPRLQSAARLVRRIARAVEQRRVERLAAQRAEWNRIQESLRTGGVHAAGVSQSPITRPQMERVTPLQNPDAATREQLSRFRSVSQTPIASAAASGALLAGYTPDAAISIGELGSFVDTAIQFFGLAVEARANLPTPMQGPREVSPLPGEPIVIDPEATMTEHSAPRSYTIATTETTPRQPIPRVNAPETIETGRPSVQTMSTTVATQATNPPVAQPTLESDSGAIRRRLVEALQRPDIRHGIPFEEETSLQPIIYQLRSDPANAPNTQVLELLPIVWNALQNPELIAETTADIWATSNRIPGTLTQTPTTRAVVLMSAEAMSAETAARQQVLRQRRTAAGNAERRSDLTTLARGMGMTRVGSVPNDRLFFQRYVATGSRFLDRGADTLDVRHGVTTHLIQDLVVDRAFQRAGVRMRSHEFRRLLGEVRTPSVQDLGQRIWNAVYDAGGRRINEPETLMPALRTVIPELE